MIHCIGKIASAKFCRPLLDLRRHLRRHCRMPTLIKKADEMKTNALYNPIIQKKTFLKNVKTEVIANYQ